MWTPKGLFCKFAAAEITKKQNIARYTPVLHLTLLPPENNQLWKIKVSNRGVKNVKTTLIGTYINI